MNLSRPITKHSTATENVFILSEDFFMPQFNQKRRIWIYLPPDYETSGNKRYPVLYMQDGQNLFDAASSFAGEWAVDNNLNALFERGESQGLIVIGIDNGSDTRTYEYCPHRNPKFGGGGGKLYLRFLVETLKPFIDQNYRTYADRDSTGIMGSSLGGLISFYAGIEFPKVFGKIGVFSPSFWFSPKIYENAKKYMHKNYTKYYFLAGRQESSNLVEQTSEMYEIMKQRGIHEDQMRLIVCDDGQHSEWFWNREFPNAYRFLYH
ncbi:MAG: alpha/beta hydrolase [Bacteroidetes bacterium]|nr:MAG: alpha/beta hydrolase [Bacteroidota bacterium]TAG87201.1 MAG: alpha/beta hydrolase [Bacteroidota bacterium]